MCVCVCVCVCVFNKAVKFHCDSQLDFKTWQYKHSSPMYPVNHYDRKHRQTMIIRLLSTKRDSENIMTESLYCVTNIPQLHGTRCSCKSLTATQMVKKCPLKVQYYAHKSPTLDPI
jgi:hypothetical protein